MALLKIIHDNKFKKREIIAWTIVFVQFITLSNYLAFPSKEVAITLKGRPQDSILGAGAIGVTTGSSSEDVSDNLLNQIKMNNHKNEYYEQRRMEATIIDNISPNESNNEDNLNESFYEKPVIHPKEAGLVSRIWRSNGSPSIHPDLHQGSCWCSFDEWCMVRTMLKTLHYIAFISKSYIFHSVTLAYIHVLKYSQYSFFICMN